MSNLNGILLATAKGLRVCEPDYLDNFSTSESNPHYVYEYKVLRQCIKILHDEMTFDVWYDTYRPIVNKLSDRDEDKFEMESDVKFETYGIELCFVLGVNQFNPRNVWTLVDGDDGMYVINGFHYVNRFAYFITDAPFEGELLEVSYIDCDEVDA